jgi:MFS superfamily sulfate permease-like transporter
VLSIMLFFKRAWWPAGEVLGRVDSLDEWHRVEVYPHAAEIPGVIVLRWEAPLFFANANQFSRTILRLVAGQPGVRCIVLQCDAITDIDVTAADVLERLDAELERRGVDMVFVELRTRLHHLLEDYGLLEKFGRRHFYESVDDAVAGTPAITDAGPAEPTPPS